MNIGRELAFSGVIYVSLPVLLFSGAGAQASIEKLTKKISLCKTIDSPVERLQCFDNLETSDFEISSKPSLPKGTGDWEVSESANPIDDTLTVTAILSSENASNYLGEKVTMILRCKSGRTEAYINWNDYLGSRAIVTDRIDKAPAERLGWQLSTDSQASFRPRAQMFMESLAEATTYLAQVTPYNESPVTASFNVLGARGVVDRIRVACGW